MVCPTAKTSRIKLTRASPGHVYHCTIAFSRVQEKPRPRRTQARSLSAQEGGKCSRPASASEVDLDAGPWQIAGNIATQIVSWLARTARPCKAAQGLWQARKGCAWREIADTVPQRTSLSSSRALSSPTPCPSSSPVFLHRRRQSPPPIFLASALAAADLVAAPFPPPSPLHPSLPPRHAPCTSLYLAVGDVPCGAVGAGDYGGDDGGRGNAGIGDGGGGGALGRWGWRGRGAGAAGARLQGRGMTQRAGRSSALHLARDREARVRSGGRRVTAAESVGAQGAIACSALSFVPADLSIGVALPGIRRPIRHLPFRWTKKVRLIIKHGEEANA